MYIRLIVLLFVATAAEAQVPTPIPPAFVFRAEPFVSGPEAPEGEPWETVVRVKVVLPEGVFRLGSGVVIHSTKDESVVLTAAHTLDLTADRVEIALFDGKMEQLDQGPGQVHFRKSVYGTFFEVDRFSDLALIRIHPKEVLPVSRMANSKYRPITGQKLLTTGCSDGEDATIWSTKFRATITRDMQIDGMHMPEYTAYECDYKPKPGRSGGGLFRGRYLIGIGNFAQSQTVDTSGRVWPENGLYATAGAIRRFLRGTDYSFLTETGNR